MIYSEIFSFIFFAVIDCISRKKVTYSYRSQKNLLKKTNSKPYFFMKKRINRYLKSLRNLRKGTEQFAKKKKKKVHEKIKERSWVREKLPSPRRSNFISYGISNLFPNFRNLAKPHGSAEYNSFNSFSEGRRQLSCGQKKNFLLRALAHQTALQEWTPVSGITRASSIEFCT